VQRKVDWVKVFCNEGNNIITRKNQKLGFLLCVETFSVTFGNNIITHNFENTFTPFFSNVCFLFFECFVTFGNNIITLNFQNNIGSFFLLLLLVHSISKGGCVL
jgi:hypothetical protein